MRRYKSTPEMIMRKKEFLVTVSIAVVLLLQGTSFSPFSIMNPTMSYASQIASSNDKIVFASLRDGNYEIYIMNTDGSNETRLTRGSSIDIDPKWSSDGKKIVFSSNYDIFVMDAEGSNLTRLTDTPGYETEPDWSPDGSKIAFVRSENNNYEIYVMDADGTDLVNLTNDDNDDRYPAWSPDGSKIAYSSSRGYGS
jgi:TolB protein